MKRNVCTISLFFYTSFCLLSIADTLAARGKTYRDVYIMEGIYSYYILLPETGTIESVLKKDIDGKTVIFDEAEKRMALKKQWDIKKTIPMKLSGEEKEILDKKVCEDSLIKSEPRQSAFVLKKKGNASQNFASDSIYSFQRGDIAYTMPGTPYYSNSSPRRTDNRAYGVYSSQNMDNLPKVVLRNPPVAGLGRMPMGYGGGMGMYNDVTVISNISDLFSTIDDRLVGEFGPLRLVPSSVNSLDSRR
ncbi:MAG: hypothetical protein ACP5UA_13030 [Candidatus Hydrogenedens sp.]